MTDYPSSPPRVPLDNPSSAPVRTPRVILGLAVMRHSLDHCRYDSGLRLPYPPPAEADGLAERSSPLPHLHRDRADPSHICTGTGLTSSTSTPGLGSPLPYLHFDWAHPAQICTGTGPSAPGMGMAPRSRMRACALLFLHRTACHRRKSARPVRSCMSNTGHFRALSPSSRSRVLLVL